MMGVESAGDDLSCGAEGLRPNCSLYALLGRNLHVRNDVGIGAFFVAGIHSGRSVAVSTPVYDGRVGVHNARIEQRVDFGVGTARSPVGSTVDVISLDVGRCAGTP